MTRLGQLCAVGFLLLALAGTASAQYTCINFTNDVELICDGYDNQGRVKYRLKFTFDFVKSGADFIRIHDGSTVGETYTYPFKTTRQTYSGRAWPGYPYTYICLTFDVYDVLPNGKVTKCSRTECGYIPCGGLEKEVVAGMSPFTDPTIVVSPNPASHDATVTIDVPSYDASSSVDIVDLNGMVVATLATALEAGEVVLPVMLSDLPSGVYMVRLQHLGGTTVQQLRVVR